MPRLTMLDIAKQTGADSVVGLIEENLQYAPEMDIIPARTINGTIYKTLIRTGLPPVGFRKLNQGVDPGKSAFAEKRVEAFLFGGRIEVDKAIVLASEESEAHLFATEATGVTKSAMIALGRQFYYGMLDDDSNGFPGLVNYVDNSLMLKATGTTANGGSSVWGVKFGPQDVQMVFGKGSVMTMDPFREESLTDKDGKKFPGYVSNLTGFVGLQCVNKYSVGRLCNLTKQADAGLLTDALIAEWLAAFPVGQTPDVLFMSRWQAFRLQKSRATVNAVGKKTATGEENWPPVPVESNGVKIVVTDSVSETEAIVA